jgi:host factor-I protein
VKQRRLLRKDAQLACVVIQFDAWAAAPAALCGREEKQMEKSAQNIQEAFLNNARKEKTFLTIYLMSGVKLSGRIKSFDKYSVILETNSQEQLIFKHAISTVVVSRPTHGYASSSSHAVAVHAAPGPPPPSVADSE